MVEVDFDLEHCPQCGGEFARRVRVDGEHDGGKFNPALGRYADQELRALVDDRVGVTRNHS
jgi:hypothetical protein